MTPWPPSPEFWAAWTTNERPRRTEPEPCQHRDDHAQSTPPNVEDNQ